MKLTDTHLILLSAASQRENHGVVLPPNLKAGAAQKVVAKLMADALLEEVRAKAGLPIWCRDENNISYALRITRKGLKAIAVDDGSSSDGSTSKGKVRAAGGQSKTPPTKAVDPGTRSSRKVDRVVRLLSQPSGASVPELIQLTGWLPHTTRAVLSGLRKAGHTVTREREEAGGSRYKLQGVRAGKPE